MKPHQAAALALTTMTLLVIRGAAQPAAPAPVPVVPGGTQALAPASPASIIHSFVTGAPREEFLQTLRGSLAARAASTYQEEFTSLIKALENEPKPPAGYDKKPAARTRAETLNTWVYDLRDQWAHDSTSGLGFPNAADRLVAAGPEAIDALISALDDPTPTRIQESAPNYGKRGGGPDPLTHLLRRQDAALECIERIAGFAFRERTARTGGQELQLRSDTPTILNNVRAWWKEAKGKSQADGLRIQMHLVHEFYGEPEGGADYKLKGVLAEIDDPAPLIPAFLAAPLEEQTQELARLDLRLVLPGIFKRFWDNKMSGVDRDLVYKFGDREVYAELVKRSSSDSTSIFLSRDVIQYGKNWSIPLLAKSLEDPKPIIIYDSAGRPSHWIGERALADFQNLTGQDFGYDASGTWDARHAALDKAAAWWRDGGEKSLAGKINANHPTETDATDLLMTDAQMLATTTAISSPDPATARSAIDSLHKAYSIPIRKALLERLSHEADPAERRKLLDRIGMIGIWQLPPLAKVFESDTDLECRRIAGDLMEHSNVWYGLMWYNAHGEEYSMHGYRAAPRDNALASLRRVALDPSTPDDLRLQAAHILATDPPFASIAVLESLATRPAIQQDQWFINNYLRISRDNRNRLERESPALLKIQQALDAND